MDPVPAATLSAPVNTSPAEKSNNEAHIEADGKQGAASSMDDTTRSNEIKNNKVKHETVASSDAVDSSSDQTTASLPNEPADGSEPSPMKKGFPFYAIIAALALSSLLTSLEATIVSTALPTVIASLGGAGLYVWIVNGYYLTQ
jgi:hypothetical protein